jgi:hypothetical protein
MAEYRFSTLWYLEAPVEAVWDAIYHSHRWPIWWRGVEQVLDLVAGDDNGLGAVQRYTWKSVLPYRLTFDMRITRIEPLVCLEGTASGEVEGCGCWRFEHEGVLTIVRYDWQVRTTKRWMNLLAPVAQPLFKWNHDAVMSAGGQGLARLLHTRLIAMVHRHPTG